MKNIWIKWIKYLDGWKRDEDAGRREYTREAYW